MDKGKLNEALKLFLAALKPQKFTDEKLNDGVTIISYEADKLDVGVAVMAVTDSGKVPLPDGDYTTADGDTFSIAGGIVTQAKEVDGAEDTAGAGAGTEKPATTAGMTESQAKTIVESVIRESRFQEQIEELKTELAGYKEAKETFSTQKTEVENEVKKLQTEIEALKTSFTNAVSLIEKMVDVSTDDAAEKPAGSTKRATAKELSQKFKNALKSTN